MSSRYVRMDGKVQKLHLVILLMQNSSYLIMILMRWY